MSLTTVVEHLLEDFHGARRLRAGSLIITVYGDAVAPRGGTVWLGSLIRVLAEFGLNQRLVRTAVFRLAQDGWLSAEQIGRRSFYSLTESGRRRFENAYRRIYTGPNEDWDRSWTLVLAPDLAGRDRESLHRELRWLGFGTIASGVFAHPMPDRQALRQLLVERDAGGLAHTMQARHLERPESEGALVRSAWDLEALAQSYLIFVDRFQPIRAAVRRSPRPDPKAAFMIRTLLIHEYRRVMLRDPKLPRALLPAGWPGLSAYALCRDLYRRIRPATERFMDQALESRDGPLPQAAPYLFERFDGPES
jgi:phenylacetic acid degradation operon negative regulatory protein